MASSFSHKVMFPLRHNRVQQGRMQATWPPFPNAYHRMSLVSVQILGIHFYAHWSCGRISPFPFGVYFLTRLKEVLLNSFRAKLRHWTRYISHCLHHEKQAQHQFSALRKALLAQVVLFLAVQQCHDTKLSVLASPCLWSQWKWPCVHWACCYPDHVNRLLLFSICICCVNYSFCFCVWN